MTEYDYDIPTAIDVGKEFTEFINNGGYKKQTNYKEYINSREWKFKSKIIKQCRGYKCQLCNISGHIAILNVHHNTYERLGIELDNDMVVLCADCHKLFHDHKRIE